MTTPIADFIMKCNVSLSFYEQKANLLMVATNAGGNNEFLQCRYEKL